MAEKDRARHAFGALENIDSAISSGKIDSFDILFVKNAEGKPFVGWIDKDGKKVICDDSAEFEALESQISTKANISDVETLQTELAAKANSEDVETLEGQIATKADVSEVEALQTELATKVDAAAVQTMIEEHSSAVIEVVEF